MYTADAPMLVGIDLAKDSFAVAIRHDESRTWTFAVDQEGLGQFGDLVADLGGFHGHIVFGLESSGPYSDLLLGWLLARNARVCLLNPLQIFRFRRAQTLRNTKTDEIDAALIAKYMDQVPEARIEVDATDDLQVLACEYESVTREIASLKNQIRQQVYVLFNEIAHGPALFSIYMLRLLEAFPSAHAISCAQPKQLRQICGAREGQGRKSPLSLDQILEQASSSISQPSSIRESVLRSKISRLLFLMDERKSLRHNLSRAVRQDQPDTYDLLMSVPGLGEVTVSLFLAQIRSLARFAGPKQLIAFAGIDPNTYESGQYTAPSHISKRGSPHLRRTLYQMAQSVRRYSVTFGTHYAQLRDRGKPYRVAIIACANKLIRVIFAIHRKHTPFRDAQPMPIS